MYFSLGTYSSFSNVASKFKARAVLGYVVFLNYKYSVKARKSKSFTDGSRFIANFTYLNSEIGPSEKGQL